MATIEERLAAIEHNHEELKQKHEELKQKIELQTIAIGALVNKATLERLNEKYDKLFHALMAHDEFTNQQLAELRERVEVQVEGKIAGMQTEMRQGFAAVNSRFESLEQSVNSRFATVDSRFDRLEALLTQVIARLPEQP